MASAENFQSTAGSGKLSRPSSSSMPRGLQKMTGGSSESEDSDGDEEDLESTPVVDGAAPTAPAEVRKNKKNKRKKGTISDNKGDDGDAFRPWERQLGQVGSFDVHFWHSSGIGGMWTGIRERKGRGEEEGKTGGKEGSLEGRAGRSPASSFARA